MMRNRFTSRFLALALLGVVCAMPAVCAQRDVDLTAADGTKLKATYFDAGKPGPGVLLLHQCNMQRKVWDGLAEQLTAAGINVLTLDNRGFGESGGTPHDKLTPEQEGKVETEKWPGDIDTAILYLESQPGVTRDMIGVGGASCGVNNSIQAARRHPEVRSLVLLSGSTDSNGRQYLQKSPGQPVFFSVADDDEFPASVQAIEWLYAITANPGKTFVHYTTGRHGVEMFSVHPELPGTIVDWYVTTLIKTPGRAPIANNPPAIPQEIRNVGLIDQPGGVAKLAKMLDDARKSDPKATLFAEAPVNLMGYDALQSGDIKGAIEIFKLNVAGYPNSPNVYDSLSDAYIVAGQKDLARENVKRALELLPSDTTDNEEFRNGLKATDEQKLKELSELPK